MPDIMSFPCANESEAHILHIPSYVDRSKISVDMAMYAITHPRLADAVVAANDRGVVGRVVTDNTLKNCNGSLVLDMIQKGVVVYIHQRPSYMPHDKS
ncbi:hypothetical protein Gpo141_00008140 [Globisporangium polare]